MIVTVLLFVFAAALQDASANSEVAVQDIDDALTKEVLQRGVGVGCDCVEDVCECCGTFEVSIIKLNQKGCVNMKYIGETASINIVFKLGERVLLNRTISANKAPKFCFSMPGLGIVASMCMDFYDIAVTEEKTKMCFRMIPKLLLRERTEHTINFGCLEMKGRKGDKNVLNGPL